MRRVSLVILSLVLLSFVLAFRSDNRLAWIPPQPEAITLTGELLFSFGVTADMRYFTGAGVYDTLSYFRGAVSALSGFGPPAFLFSPGDIDPPDATRWTIDQVLGSTYRWVPVVGNHELPGAGVESAPGANLAWLETYNYGAVNPGPTGCPTTTFSFDYLTAHFVVLNEYCDTTGSAATDGDITDHLFNWLAADLAASHQRYIFVIGHEPAFPQPDRDNGLLRHETDSLNQYPANRDRFWSLLKNQRVTAYLCGHTHTFSAANIAGLWQIDAGHARGQGDTTTPSTLVLIQVRSQSVVYQAYRDGALGGPYILYHQGVIAQSSYIPLIRR